NSQAQPPQANLQQQTEVLMPNQSERQRTQHALRMMAGFVIAAVVMMALYFGRDIFIPLALAILLAFLLSPLVSRLKRRGCPQWAAIGLVMCLTLSLLGGAATYLGMQLGKLSQELPQYQDTIQQKLNMLKDYRQGPSMWDGAIQTFDTVESSIDSPEQEAEDPNVQNVKVVGLEPSSEEAALDWLNKILNPLAVIGIVFLFMVLILLNGKDLHDRFLKLLGGNLNIGTDALDDAAKSIGTYLRMQLLVNVTYGIPMAIGLLLIGVPAAIMWGLVAVVMRFVPYVGPIVSAIFPITLAFAVDPGWDMVLWTVALIVVLELISNNVIEPWLYGESTGLSTLAIILAATFWTTLWGPVGLILSTPLTACLLVLSNYVPALGFVKTLLGSTPVLSPSERFYQRLVADEVNDAMQVANDYICAQLPKKPSAEVVARKIQKFYAEVAIPAIRIFSQGHDTDVTAEHRLRLYQGLQLFNHAFQKAYPSPMRAEQLEIYCVGARWEIDTQISAMLAHVLNLKQMAARNDPDLLIQSGESEQGIVLPASIKILCVSIFHHAPAAQIRLLKYKLAQQYPELKVIFATWGVMQLETLDELQQRFQLDALVNNFDDLILTIETATLNEGESWFENLEIRNQQERQQILTDLALLDRSHQPLYKQYIEEARQAFDVDYAQISWLDQQQMHIPVSPFTQEPVAIQQLCKDSVCTHLLYQNEPLVIEDLQRDPRFPHLSELRQQHIRFYAGVPLRDKNGIALGSFCLLDKQPRQMQAEDMILLNALAQDLMATLSNERKKKDKQKQIEQMQPATSAGISTRNK
ncbi:MAG: AI-2E family transporter, partial [Acinetobacter sp.]